MEERGLELHLERREGVVCGLNTRRGMIGFAQDAEGGSLTYKCELGREHASLERRVLRAHDQGFPGEEVGFGDRT